VSDFDPPPAAVRAAVHAALAEDLGLLGDITSLATIPADSFASGRFVARDEGVLAGTAAATETYHQVDPDVALEWQAADGDPAEPGQVLGVVRGPARSLFAGERVALNLLGLLSGVATGTRRYVRATHGRARILDTRKTLPGLRALQKAAVRAGGGFNHRESLSDAVLLKDNHLSLVGVERGVARARARWPGRLIEVECDRLDTVRAAIAAGVDRLMLDNMTPAEVREAVALVAGACAIEVSGRVTIDNVGEYAAAGADYISIGAITHSVRVFDIGLDLD
jgi:nicotinate-nucleotide pyrophosphorylase (carboxylating)